jgi:hypothetical protein
MNRAIRATDTASPCDKAHDIFSRRSSRGVLVTMSLSASTGSGNSDAQFPAMGPDTNARAAAPRKMEQALVLAQRRSEPVTPYLWWAWRHALVDAGLLDRYPSVVRVLREGFVASFPSIQYTFRFSKRKVRLIWGAIYL